MLKLNKYDFKRITVRGRVLFCILVILHKVQKLKKEQLYWVVLSKLIDFLKTKDLGLWEKEALTIAAGFINEKPVEEDYENFDSFFLQKIFYFTFYKKNTELGLVKLFENAFEVALCEIGTTVSIHDEYPYELIDEFIKEGDIAKKSFSMVSNFTRSLNDEFGDIMDDNKIKELLLSFDSLTD